MRSLVRRLALALAFALAAFVAGVGLEEMGDTAAPRRPDDEPGAAIALVARVCGLGIGSLVVAVQLGALALALRAAWAARRPAAGVAGPPSTPPSRAVGAPPAASVQFP